MSGLVAFFDIPGYQSFLENNSVTDSAIKVLDLITGIPTTQQKGLGAIWKQLESGKPHGKTAVEVAESLRHLVFSDTIVLTIQYPKNVTDDWKRAALAYLTISSGNLASKMFMEGLPLRGAIVEGDFVLKESCLAGRAIVDAYRLCSSLDLAAVVFSSELSDRVLKSQTSDPIFTTHNFGRYFCVYLTPVKSASEVRVIHINWVAYLEASEAKAFLKDIDTSILRSFWSHEKDCPLSANAKVANTQKLARRFALALEIPG